MRRTLRALAALLSYPTAELQAAIPEIREAVLAEGALPARHIAALEPLFAWFTRPDLMEVESDYVELFDRGRSLSLHLFEHVHGESRDRGQAMIDLGQQYLDRGFIMEGSELPDYLPMFLEFTSCLPEREAREWLSQPAHVFAALEERLREREAPHAAIFGALVALPRAKPDPQALAELRQRMAAEDAKTIDEQWEEAPVSFGTPPWEAGGPTGVVAKIRAALRRPPQQEPGQ